MIWLIDCCVHFNCTYTFHLLFIEKLNTWRTSERLLLSCIPKHKNFCVQWRSYFTAAISFSDYPKHPPVTCDAEYFHPFNSSVSSLRTQEVFQPSRGWSSLFKQKHDEIYSLIGRGAEIIDRQQASVLKLVVRQFSLMLYQVYNHFNITVSLQYVASIHLNEHESTGWLFGDKLKHGQTKVIILRFAARVQTRLFFLLFFFLLNRKSKIEFMGDGVK